MGRITTAEKIKRFRNKKNNDVAYNHSESKRVEKCRKAPVDKMPKSKKEEYKIKARDKESAVLKRKQNKKILTLLKLYIPLLLPTLYLISIYTTPSNPMERLQQI